MELEDTLPHVKTHSQSLSTTATPYCLNLAPYYVDCTHDRTDSRRERSEAATHLPGQERTDEDKDENLTSNAHDPDTDPASSHPVTWANDIFAGAETATNADVQSLMQEAADAARNDFDEDSAVAWAKGYKFPAHYMDSDLACLRAAQRRHDTAAFEDTFPQPNYALTIRKSGCCRGNARTAPC